MVWKLLALKLKTKNRQTRNRNLNFRNLHRDIDSLGSCAKILINALRKWGVLPSDELICEVDEKFFKVSTTKLQIFTFLVKVN